MNTAPERGNPAAGRRTQSGRRSQWKRYLPLVIAALVVVISVALRIAYRNVVTSDLDVHVLVWYAKLQKRGILVGLGQDFYNYTPPYLYLVALATLTSKFMSAVISIKLISTAFDLGAAFLISLIVRLRHPRNYLPVLAGALFFVAPTVVANTGVWGQADSSYTTFLLACLYLLLIDRPLPAVVCFGVALAFKPQAVFFVPLLLVMLLWKKVRWWHFTLVPAVYALMMWPAVALGRTWSELFTTYFSQAGSGKGLTHNAATLYVFIPKEAFALLIGRGVFVAGALLLIWVVYTWLRTRNRDRAAILLMATISVTLTPFLLPNMHDRYFYPADAISIALAFTMPELWFIPIFFQFISGLSYSIYLLSASPDNLQAAATLNALTLIILLMKQVMLNRSPGAPPSPESVPEGTPAGSGA